MSPELATSWLEGNTHNRPISDRKVNDYVRDIKTDNWALNGEPIIFDWDGTLRDGQHRLWACITAKKSFRTLVVRGVDPETFRTIDTGKARSAGDVLGIDKQKNPNTLAAAAQNVIRYLEDGLKGTTKIPNATIAKFVDDNPSLSDWIIKLNKGDQKKWSSTVAAVLFLANEEKEKAETFGNKFVTGENLEAGSAILALRNRFARSKSLGRAQRMELAIRSWNAFVVNRTISVIPINGEVPKILGSKWG